MALSVKEIQKRYIERRKAAGWVKFQKWVPPDLAIKIVRMCEDHKRKEPEKWKR